MRNYVLLAVSLVLLRFESLEAMQQATSFEQLQVLVKAGDTISITDLAGTLSKGRIADLSASAVRIQSNGVIRDFQENEVSEIRQRRGDSLTNGAKIGALVGVAVGVLGAIGLCTDSEADSCPAWAAASIGFYTGLGTGVGVGIDALIKRETTIYRPRNSRSSSRISFAPIVSVGRKGIRLSVSF